MLPLVAGAELTIYVASSFPDVWTTGVVVCADKPTPSGRWLDSSLVRWKSRW